MALQADDAQLWRVETRADERECVCTKYEKKLPRQKTKSPGLLLRVAAAFGPSHEAETLLVHLAQLARPSRLRVFLVNLRLEPGVLWPLLEAAFVQRHALRVGIVQHHKGSPAHAVPAGEAAKGSRGATRLRGGGRGSVVDCVGAGAILRRRARCGAAEAWRAVHPLPRSPTSLTSSPRQANSSKAYVVA